MLKYGTGLIRLTSGVPVLRRENGPIRRPLDKTFDIPIMLESFEKHVGVRAELNQAKFPVEIEGIPGDVL